MKRILVLLEEIYDCLDDIRTELQEARKARRERLKNETTAARLAPPG